MDLKESRIGKPLRRHPWELSRAGFVLNRISRLFPGDGPENLLDAGAGDGFFIERFLQRYPEAYVEGIDTALEAPAKLDKSMIRNRWSSIEGESFQLVTAMDVLEHVDDDAAFLQECSGRLDDGGFIVVTVPMHQNLFSNHDLYLGHRRRYSMAELKTLARRTSLEMVESGQFYFSLLVVRLLQKMAGSKLAGGVGDWRGGAALTGISKTAFDIDHRIFAGILPGLSGWMVLKKRA